MIAIRVGLSAMLMVLLASSGQCATVVLSSSSDATIFQNNVDNGSGGGNGLYAGTNSSGSSRRSLIAFDIAGGLLAGSVVQSVELTAVLGQISGSSPPPLVTIGLHRASATWGNGTTLQRIPPDDTMSGMGQGSAALAGDVTWNARFYSTTTPTLWSSPGGDFDASARALAAIGATLGVRYSWPSTPALVNDVQAWLDDPESNSGWMLKVVDETLPITLRGFYSGDVATSSLRPQLLVTFDPPLEGDFNGDQSVDGGDLDRWTNQFGTLGVLSADADTDHDVDGADFLIWQRHLTTLVMVIPEPAAWTLLVLGAAFGWRRPSLSGLRIDVARGIRCREPSGLSRAGPAER